jgi:hypothetical protein
MTNPAAMIPKLTDKTLRMKMGFRRVYGFESANRRIRSGTSIEPKTVAMRMKVMAGRMAWTNPSMIGATRAVGMGGGAADMVCSIQIGVRGLVIYAYSPGTS